MQKSDTDGLHERDVRIQQLVCQGREYSLMLATACSVAAADMVLLLSMRAISRRIQGGRIAERARAIVASANREADVASAFGCPPASASRSGRRLSRVDLEPNRLSVPSGSCWPRCGAAAVP